MELEAQQNAQQAPTPIATPLPEGQAAQPSGATPAAAEASPNPSAQDPSPAAPQNTAGAPQPENDRAIAPSAAGGVMAELRARPLRYTYHARCRMECREIDESEVEALLRTGRIDPSRTRPASRPGQCQTYAVEGNTNDGQRVRIVYGACDDETRVITAIDLGEDHPCGDC